MRQILLLSLLCGFILINTSCSSRKVSTYREPSRPQYSGKLYQTGVASWYGPKFNGRKTANGEIYNMNILTAAHKQLPFNTLVEVKNTRNGRRVMVRINDRGPFVKNRIIDLSKKAASRIDMLSTGTAPVEIRILKPGDSPVYVNNRPVKQREAGYFIQAGAFGDPDNARRYLRKVKSILPEMNFKLVRADRILRITSASFKSRSKIEQAIRTLRANGIDCIMRESY